MIKYSVILLLFFVNTAFAEKNCIQAKVDYQRSCGDVTNLNNLRALKNENDCAIVKVESQSQWNASNLRLEKGKNYKIEVINGSSSKWCDASVVSDYLGWDTTSDGNKPGSMVCPPECKKCKADDGVAGPGVDLGTIGNIAIKSSWWLRRHPDSKLFALFGAVKGEAYEKKFNITNPLDFSPKRDAEFCAYANDLSFMYGNNSGSLQLKITNSGNN